MLSELKELYRYRELLWTFVVRELRIRYKNSVLGFFWSILNPLITVLVMTVVFKYVLNVRVPNYSAYLLAAYLPFMFFQLALLDSAQSILTQLPLLKKIYFPREILPIGSVIANFLHFLLAMGVFFLYLLFVWWMNPGENPFRATVFWLPLLVLLQFCLTLGLALFISALNTFYEDVKYLVSVGLYLLFFLCPILYFVEQVWAATHSPDIPAQWQDTLFTIYNLNPIGMLLVGYRKLMLDPQPITVTRTGDVLETHYLPLDWTMLAIAGAVSVLVMVAGYAYFNKVKWRFVERP